jgi:hypothetical protein
MIGASMNYSLIAVPSFFLVLALGACSGSIEQIVDDDGGDSSDAESASDAHADGGVKHDAGHSDGGLFDGGRADASSGSDAFLGSDAIAGGECNALVNGAPQVTANQVASVAPPATGGTLVDGTYFLTSVTIYTGFGGATGPTGSAESVTLQLASGIAQSVAGSSGSVSHETATLTPTSPTTLTASTTCPAPKTPTTLSYSATATSFFAQSTFGSTTILEAFTKQ